MKLTETCDLTFLLLLYTLQFGLFLFLTLSLRPVIFNNLLFQVFLLLLPLVLHLDGPLVGDLDFSNHAECALLLGLDHFVLLDLELLSLADHLLHLALAHLLILDAIELALLDLVDDDEGALLLCLLALDFALLLQLEGLESLDLHHEVEALLLLYPLLLEALGLVELAVTDGHNLGVKHHLVHVLHIIMVLVHHLLSLGQQTLRLFLVNELLLSGRHLDGTLLVQLQHALLSGLSGCHG